VVEIVFSNHGSAEEWVGDSGKKRSQMLPHGFQS
jgi:hypothetical protein